ncbi:dynamin-related protein 4C-like isoform X1 [Cucumis melo]|uniref:Dynamin-related protein 4C-like isoform X1 n=2 Tax=Cucumis melo TaxID=3656 RepID=A0A1S3B4X0_CUCME|nr:dynamin-related protein 4C-like isoform X1 [Cucumis melo]
MYGKRKKLKKQGDIFILFLHPKPKASNPQSLSLYNHNRNNPFTSASKQITIFIFLFPVSSNLACRQRMAQYSNGSSSVHQGESSCLSHSVSVPPLIISYNDRIRPLLDAVDKLRHLMIMREGIQLPTIVVVGDQSSGKSSVLESLAGISLPRGQGICTRVPLIMRLQNHPDPEPELVLEYNGKKIHTDESFIAEDICTATEEIAGSGKGISKAPLTLIVKKNGVPDLTMVDLPGITRVPVKDQPEDIYDQIKDIIMEHIKPEESIILNVLSATVDFPTCESIRMSQSVDKTGMRTLAVVTKSDKAPEGLHEKVTTDDVSIGLGYVCVRNRIGNETYEEARVAEAKLFSTHPLLSKIDKSVVGIPVLAQKLVQIQAGSIARCMPEVIKQINEKLATNIAELNKMPKKLSTVAEAMTTFMQIIGQAKESLRKILLRGEYDEFPNDEKMHSTARMVEMINQFSNELHKCIGTDDTANFLIEEIKVLEESRGIGLPNFLPRAAFLSILQRKVNLISNLPVEFVMKVWDYIQVIVLAVLMHHSEHYPQLQQPIRRAGKSVVERMKDRSISWITEVVEMEKLTDYTCDAAYTTEWNKLMTQQQTFLNQVLVSDYRPATVFLEGFGKIEVGNLWEHPDVLQQAFDLKMRMTAYWKIVLRRMVDSTALYLQYGVQNLVNKEIEKETIGELMSPSGGGIERLLEESPSLSVKREKLKKSIKLLKESKDIVGSIVDSVSVSYSDQ